LGRPIMAIVKDISDPSAFGAYFRKKVCSGVRTRICGKIRADY
jgi:hypothetical protein